MAKKISSLSVVLGATVKPFVSAFGAAKGAVGGFVSSLSGAGASILKFTGLGAGLGAIFAAFKGAASGISLAAELEQNAVAFETMLGSASAAGALMGELTKFASATPFQFPEIASSAKKLLAFGIGADQITNKLTMLGDIAAGIGAPMEDIASIYGKIKSRGQLTGETLNQLAERGVPIYKALAATLGVNENQIAGMVSKGQIGFGQVDKALQGLTATGGQFSGMMAKQSQTMAGLWSTLTDNIGLAVAGLVTTLFDAFGLRDVLAALASGIGTAGDAINGFVQWIAPVLIGWMKSLWDGVVTIFTAIWGFVGPIVSAIGAWVADHWRAMVETTIAYYTSIWNAASAIFGAVWSVVVSIGQAIVAAWTWAMDALGLSSYTAGATVGGVFSKLVELGQWVMQQMTLAFNVIAYAITHWRDTIDLAVYGALYNIVKFANQCIYFFTDVIPGVLRWFAGNWRDIFQTLWNGTKAVFENLIANAANFFKAIWSWIKGNGFDFKWTGLLTGFENTIKEMPAIAERQIGPLEKALGDEAARLGAAYSKGLGEYLVGQEKQAKDATQGIANGVQSAVDTIAQAPGLTTPTVPPIQVKAQADTTEVENIGKAAKESKDKLDALFSGEAAAQKEQFEARFAARLAPATGATSASPKAAPMPAGATQSVREAAGQDSTLKQLLALVPLAQKSESHLDKIASADNVLAVAEF